MRDNLRCVTTDCSHPPVFPPVRCGAVLLGIVFLSATGLGLAHQIPSLTVEAFFAADRGFTLRINVDPRLILSDQPASLPPVPVEWYTDQKPEERAAAEQKAAAYLRKVLTMKFGTMTAAVEKCSFLPMDGATNMPLSADTKEVHLLAETKGKVPAGQDAFSLALSQEAGVSMILMNSFEGTMERRPNVVFPGESSRPFRLAFPAASAPAPAVSGSEATPDVLGDAKSRPPATSRSVAILVAVLLAAVIVVVLRGRRAKA